MTRSIQSSQNASMAESSASFLTAASLRIPGVVHGFSTRKGGVSEGPFASMNLGRSVGDTPDRVSENHQRLLEAAGAGSMSLAEVNQVHGAVVWHLEPHPGPRLEGGDADALISTRPGWVVGVRTADCVPILIAGPGVVAAVHAGWRGTAARIVVETVRQIQARYGVAPSSLHVAIGPSIAADCYPVGEDVIEGLTRALETSPGGFQGVSWPRSAGAVRVDLQEANRRLLLESGVQAASIEVLSHCVSCDAMRFFSHRRDRGQTGRMLNFIGLQQAAGTG